MDAVLRTGVNNADMLRDQFTLPIYFDLCATFLFGMTGALAALKRGYDIIGLFALAFATAVGGGLIRDGIFISQGPPAVTKDSSYILVVILAGGAVFLFREHIVRFNKFIALLDALGLGAYAVVGVQKALGAGLSLAAAILVGVITAVGGGLLRDVLVRDEPLMFKPGQFYVVAALLGCGVFVLLKEQFGRSTETAALIAIGATFAFRVLAIQFNWKTSPLWRETDVIAAELAATAPTQAPQSTVSPQESLFPDPVSKVSNGTDPKPIAPPTVIPPTGK